MVRPRIFLLLIVGVVLITQATLPRCCIGELPPCTGKYKALTPPDTELTEILKQHNAWVKEGGILAPKLINDPRRANLAVRT